MFLYTTLAALCTHSTRIIFTPSEVKNGKCEEVKQDGNTGLKSVEEPQVTMGRLDHEVLFYFSGQLCVADSSVKIVNTVY